MAENTNIADLVNRMPPLDEPTTNKDGKKETRDAGKLTGPAWPAAAAIIDPILAAGPAGITALLDLIKELDNGEDYQARYTMHALCIYCCRPDKSEQRNVLVTTLIEQLGSNRPKPTLGLILRELRDIGDARIVPAAGKLLLDEQLSADALAAILAIRQGAAEQIRAALPSAKARIRLSLIQALGTLRDTASAPALRQAAADPDVDTRLAAFWSLATLPDAQSADTLLKAATTEGYGQSQATKACLLLAENLSAAGQKADAKRIYETLRTSRKDPKDQYLRDIATAAMSGL